MVPFFQTNVIITNYYIITNFNYFEGIKFHEFRELEFRNNFCGT